MRETVDARKQRIEGDAALTVADGCEEVVACRGKRVTRLDLAAASRDDVLGALLGPTGNLRAPTLRVGRRLLVGFDEAVYDEVLRG